MKGANGMKRFLAVILAALILFALTGCGKKEDMTFTEKKDLGISVNGKWYPIHEDFAPLLSALGDEYELYSGESCVFEGLDKEFVYSFGSVFTNPDGDKDIWYNITLTDATYSTARGIKVGDSMEALVAAYGENYYSEGEGLVTYSVSGVQGDISSPCIIFTLEGDTIVMIEIYYPTNVT